MVDFDARMKRCRAAYPTEFDHGVLLRTLRHPAVTEEVLTGQHSIRMWEYSRALRALEAWQRATPAVYAQLVDGSGLQVADIGGAGSHFYKALMQYITAHGRIHIVDPDLPTPDGQPGVVHAVGEPGIVRAKYSLGTWAHRANHGYDVVFCLSVLEHVPAADVDGFLGDLRSLVRPGGLLFLTCDMGETAPDTYHFHWMRQWIPTPSVLAGLVEQMREYGFQPLGAPADFTYKGATVYDYTVASMALVRS